MATTFEEDLPTQIASLSQQLASGTYELLVLIARADAEHTWETSGSLSCAAWLAELCAIELSTARNQLRVARAMIQYPELDSAMARGDICYAKARIMAPHLSPESINQLVDLASNTSVGRLSKAIAAWTLRNEDPDTIERRQRHARSVTWHTEPDGMIVVTARLQPSQGARVCAAITAAVQAGAKIGSSEDSVNQPSDDDNQTDAPAGAHQRQRRPTLAQQRADALLTLATDGGSSTVHEVVVHVDVDGNHLADGTPLSDNAVARLLPSSFVSLLMHDSARQPIDASPRRRFPTRRQKRVVDARHSQCAQQGCNATSFLQYDHKDPYASGGPTVIDNLQRLCGPHNRQKNPR